MPSALGLVVNDPANNETFRLTQTKYIFVTPIPSISDLILTNLVHAVPHEDSDPRFGRCSFPVFSPSLAHRPRTQCRLTQDHI